MTLFERLQQKVWQGIYPVFPYLERAASIFYPKERQPYYIGHISHGKTAKAFGEYLAKEWGFADHFVAWQDPGQTHSWRKRIGFRHQYHFRVFEDGEVRGHYELTPEAAPIKHFFAEGQEARPKEFIKFLGGFVDVHDKYMLSKSPREAEAALTKPFAVRGQVPKELWLYRVGILRKETSVSR